MPWSRSKYRGIGHGSRSSEKGLSLERLDHYYMREFDSYSNQGCICSPWQRWKKLVFDSSTAEDILKPTNTEKAIAKGVNTVFEVYFYSSASGRNRKSHCARPGQACIRRLNCQRAKERSLSSVEPQTLDSSKTHGDCIIP